MKPYSEDPDRGLLAGDAARLHIARLKLALLARAPGKDAERAELERRITALLADYGLPAPTLGEDGW